MADPVEDVEARLTALETRVDTEVTAVQEHFAELQQSIRFSLDQQATRLRTEWREDLKPIDRRLGTVEYRLETMDRRFDRMDQRFDGLEGKVDAHHAATQTALREIVGRLVAVEDRVAGVDTEVARLATKLAGVEDKVARLATTLAGVEDRVARLEDRVARLEGSVARLDDRVARLEDQATAHHAATQKVLQDILSRLPQRESR